MSLADVIEAKVVQVNGGEVIYWAEWPTWAERQREMASRAMKGFGRGAKRVLWNKYTAVSAVLVVYVVIYFASYYFALWLLTSVGLWAYLTYIGFLVALCVWAIARMF